MLDPDMSAQQMKLHAGEMTAQEIRTARAFIRLANSKMKISESTHESALIDNQAIDALSWFIENDDTNDTEYNRFWIEGVERGRKALADLKGKKYIPGEWDYHKEEAY